MGNTQIMLFKISWDWAVYWGVPCLLFTNKTFTDLKVLKNLFAADDSLGRKFGNLNKIMQDLFLEWQKYETAIFSDSYVDAFDARILKEFQKGMVLTHRAILWHVASGLSHQPDRRDIRRFAAAGFHERAVVPSGGGVEWRGGFGRGG